MAGRVRGRQRDVSVGGVRDARRDIAATRARRVRRARRPRRRRIGVQNETDGIRRIGNSRRHSRRRENARAITRTHPRILEGHARKHRNHGIDHGDSRGIRPPRVDCNAPDAIARSFIRLATQHPSEMSANRADEARSMQTFFTHRSVSIFDRVPFQLTDERLSLNLLTKRCGTSRLRRRCGGFGVSASCTVRLLSNTLARVLSVVS